MGLWQGPLEEVEVNTRFWHDRRVFLTGHTGFKGAWCALVLTQLGARVTGYALAPATSPNLFESAGLGREMPSVIGDIRDRERLRSALLESQADVVVHMAAQSLVTVGYEKPVETYAINAAGTAAIVDVVRACQRTRALVVITSDKCYRLRDPAARYAESDPLGGRDPYSASKAAAEYVVAGMRAPFVQARSESASLQVATARAGNVIGGGDWAKDRLVPDLINAFRAGKEALVRHPDAIRPWQHVLEPIYGYLELAQVLYERAGFARAWNFGPAAAHERSVGWIADRVASEWGESAAWKRTAASVYEAPALRLDSSAARAKLGWAPALDLETSLAWTVSWYKQFAAGRHARELTLADIERYRSLVAA